MLGLGFLIGSEEVSDEPKVQSDYPILDEGVHFIVGETSLRNTSRQQQPPRHKVYSFFGEIA